MLLLLGEGSGIFETTGTKDPPYRLKSYWLGAK